MNMLGFSPTLRWIITLAYTNQRISEEKSTIFVFLWHLFKFVNRFGSWQLFRVIVTISASFVKLRPRIMFKNIILPWKTPKPMFVLIGMAFSFISEIEYRSNFPETVTPCFQIRVQSCEPGISSNYSPKWRWISWAFTDTEMNNNVSIYPTSESVRNRPFKRNPNH